MTSKCHWTSMITPPHTHTNKYFATETQRNLKSKAIQYVWGSENKIKSRPQFGLPSNSEPHKGQGPIYFRTAIALTLCHEEKVSKLILIEGRFPCGQMERLSLRPPRRNSTRWELEGKVTTHSGPRLGHSRSPEYNQQFLKNSVQPWCTALAQPSKMTWIF